MTQEFDLGYIRGAAGPTGPQGPAGQTGPQGPAGATPAISMNTAFTSLLICIFSRTDLFGDVLWPDRAHGGLQEVVAQLSPAVLRIDSVAERIAELAADARPAVRLRLDPLP